MTLVPASDGLPARLVRSWNPEKLFYIDRYLDIFTTGMRGKWSLVYADLLAGPGICVEESSRSESYGSSLLAVQHKAFDRIFLNDIDLVAANALRARTANERTGRVLVESRDCNDAVERARDVLFPRFSASRSLGLAVIDPTAFQFWYDSVVRLTAGVRLDLIIIFMTGYVRRFIRTPEFERTLDEFFGTAEWRALIDHSRDGERITYRKLLDLYEGQLRKLGYSHVNDDARILNSKGSTIYHIVFASKHPRGADFFTKISRRIFPGQRRLL